MNHLVITGGSGGLGSAIVQEFRSSDWEVFAPGRFQVDVSCRESIGKLEQLDAVDLLVCAAGITRDASLAKATHVDWEEVCAVNYAGAATCAAAVLPRMISRGKGHIIFISSHSAQHPPAGQVAYATSKAALIGLASALAVQNGRYNIRVNTILPGFLQTRMTEAVSVRRRAEVLKEHVLGRFNNPPAVARFIRYLHENLQETSGQVFQLDSRLP